MKYRVNWKLEGTYTVTPEDLDLPEDASLEEATEVINREPFLGVDPLLEGIDTIVVVEE